MFFYERQPKTVQSPLHAGVPIVLAFDEASADVSPRFQVTIADAFDGSARHLFALSVAPLPEDLLRALRLVPATPNLWMVFDLVVVRSGQHNQLPVDILRLLLGLRIRNTKVISADGHFKRYARPQPAQNARVLFLFPGLFCPAELGSHQRACALVLKFLEIGYNVDIIVQSAHVKNINTRQQYFDLLSPNVTHVVVPKALKSERRLQYEALCADQSIKPSFPLTLSERATHVATPAMKAAIKAQLNARPYTTVLSSYGWFYEIFRDDALFSGTRRPKLVVDTHDAHWMRLTQHLDAAATAVFDMEEERALEISVLETFDHILAISERDKEVFTEDFGFSNVTNLPVSYTGGDFNTRPKREGRPLRFGFIGSGMDANRKALDYLLREWWPDIHAFSPDSPLLIGGQIAKDPHVQDAIFLKDEIEPVGFVDFVEEYYNDIDVLLSPVLVPGGLNIKMVEGLLNKCIVMTNNLGAQPLRPLDIVTRAQTGAEVVALLSRIEDTEPDLMAAIAANFSSAKQFFKEQNHDIEKLHTVFSQ
ncbi:glycosyltransferase [Profundibacter sp.]